VSEGELERQALAADPSEEIPLDAVPFGVPATGADLLPAWYMPVPQRVDRSFRRVSVLAGLVVALLLVNGAGLCVTYGWPEVAW
jgi:hypothetical protein